jgi:predicted ArsR family transcriptional regulator
VPPACCSEDLVLTLDELGFDTASVMHSDDGTNRTAVAFGNCPLSHLAEEEPQIICALHQGLMEGFAAECDGELTVERFNDLASRTPCSAELVEPLR